MNERQDPLPRPELLAPAGSRDAYLAAVSNGADAVYLGLREFNARRGAANFSLEELAEVTRHAHLRGRRVYLTVNILTLTAEMPEALSVVDEAWAAGVDAVIVQDLGLLRLLRRELPDVRIHASTQLDAHNAPSVEVLASLGAARVTLARETSLEEVAALAATGIETESFVHGSLCFCYSGQCLMSSLIGGRSANRGLCAQPCRMAYALVDESGHEAPVPGSYLLSPKDLAGITVLPRLIATGVRALKIEGRMKSPEYVALVVGVYRAALDRAWADPDGFAVTPGEWATLEEAFSRGFTEGALTGRSGEELMSYQRPNNRGVPVGRIVAADGGSVTASLGRALDAADVLEVWTRRGRFAQKAGVMTVHGTPVEHAPAGVRAVLALERPAAAGDRLFRVANASLLAAARRTWTEERRTVPLDAAVRVDVGRPLELRVEAAGVSACVEGPVVEPARTKRVTADEVAEHVSRLGGTPYRVESWDIELDPSAGVGFSALHALRRDALAALDERRLAPWAGRGLRRPSVSLPQSRLAAGGSRAPLLVASVSSLAAASSCATAGADRVLLDVSFLARSGALSAAATPLLPRVAHDGEIPGLLEGVAGAAAAVTGNLGLLRLIGERGTPVEADWGLNAVNPWTVEALADLGASLVWASPELSGRQLAAAVASSPVPVGVLVYGRLELMVAEQCVVSAAGPCDRGCASCARRAGSWTLRDRKGYEFPVRSDARGRAHVYNSVTLDLSRAVAELLDSGVAALRLELGAEDPSEAASAVRSWRTVLDDAVAGRAAPTAPLREPATTGHFYRGVR